MKTKRLIIMVVAPCLGVAFAAMLVEQHRSQITEHETSGDVNAVSASNNAPSNTNQYKTAATAEVNGKTNAISAEGFSLKIIDSKTGQYAIVGLDRQTIALKDKNGNDIWTMNLANEASKRGWHPMGVEMGAFDKKKPTFWVEVVNGSFELDLHTGEIIGMGAGRMHNP
jgi:hypothetical protein